MSVEHGSDDGHKTSWWKWFNMDFGISSMIAGFFWAASGANVTEDLLKKWGWGGHHDHH